MDSDDLGSRIELCVSPLDWRDYLDFTCSGGEVQSRAVHAGDGLELWRDGAWTPVRYESPRGQVGWLFFDDEHSYKLERQTMRLRWPTSR